MANCRLYLITPPELPDPVAFSTILASVIEIGSIISVQLRLKDVDDALLLRTIDILRPVIQGFNIPFLLNDRADLAAKSGCDGVHIGQEDVSYSVARFLVGVDALIGVTCHNSLGLARTAIEQGADYVSFGSFFPTRTKPPQHWASTSLIKQWVELCATPCVAIGGITPFNCLSLVRAGASSIAISSGVWNYPAGPVAAVNHFKTVLNSI